MSARDLAGMRVALTRERSQSEQSARDVLERGGIPCVFPLLQFASIAKHTDLSAALDALRPQDIIAFTSANGVQFSFSAAATALVAGMDRGVRFAAVGERTAEALTRAAGVLDPIMPVLNAQSGAGLAQALLPITTHGEGVLVLGARDGRPELADALRAAGRPVHALAVYETLPCDAHDLWTAILSAQVDAVIFASPSAVQAFVEGRTLSSLPKRLLIAAIGATTRHHAERCGLRVDVTPDKPTLHDLLDALATQCVS